MVCVWVLATSAAVDGCQAVPELTFRNAIINEGRFEGQDIAVKSTPVGS